jgi:hypothetical protein
MKRTILLLSLVAFLSPMTLCAQDRGVVRVANMAPCKNLPSSITVLATSPQCRNMPTVILRGVWKRSFSAAFRWDDGSSDGQDRHPNKLSDGSASSSPYKTQRRIRKSSEQVLCYGNFLKLKVPIPEQLTIKRSVAPRVDRFCVDFAN